MLPVPSMTNRDDLARWHKLWQEGAHGALLNEIGQAMKAGELPAEGYGLGALACIALERFDEAAKAGQNGVTLAPREAWLFGALADAYRGLARAATRAAGAPAAGTGPSDWAKAITAADQAVRLAPAEPAWHALGARLRREAGFTAEALQSAERGLQRHPDSVHLLVERGLASGALTDLRQAQAIAPTDPWPFEAEGHLHGLAGNVAEAAVAYRRALRLAPAGPAAEAIEDQLARAIAPRAPLTGLLRLLLLTARVTVIGWVVILFGYYIFFRLLQIGWKLAPVLKPFGQGLLLATAVGGALLVAGGHLTRLLLRQGKR
ncbi:MAG TPA: hypothetical protein VK191_00925 [Symbiobacteriaceae bacterium]|nr:hypothetical protein [Symbiobacteriaceae bacterium]